MNRNLLLAAIAVLAISAGVLGYGFYQQQQRPGVDIGIGTGGVTIERR